MRGWPKYSRCFVYFVQEGSDGAIKIGYARGVASRLALLQAGNPRPLRLLAAIQGARSVEYELHARFAYLRLFGEWFSPGSELVDFISGLADQAIAPAAPAGGSP